METESKTDIDFDLYHKWIKALRSGKYAQGRTRLRRVIDGEESFCCLGVLCQISGTSDWNNLGSENGYSYGESDLVSPPEDLLKRLGLNFNLACGNNPDHSTFPFWEMNDTDNLTFAEIADLIEVTLTEAFGYEP